MPLYMKMSKNINETTRHLKFRYISILTNLLRTLLLRHLLYLYFMKRKASYENLLNMLFDIILSDLLLHILFTSVLNFVGLMPSCLRGSKIFFVGISWVQNIFSWVFRGSKIFSRGYVMDQKCFLVGISWVQNFMTFNKLQ